MECSFGTLPIGKKERNITDTDGVPLTKGACSTTNLCLEMMQFTCEVRMKNVSTFFNRNGTVVFCTDCLPYFFFDFSSEKYRVLSQNMWNKTDIFGIDEPRNVIIIGHLAATKKMYLRIVVNFFCTNLLILAQHVLSLWEYNHSPGELHEKYPVKRKKFPAKVLWQKDV